MKRIVILGAGTAGTMMAHKLSNSLHSDQWSIVVVDQDNEHIYQPGLLFVPFGMYRPEDLVRSRNILLPPAVELILSTIDKVDPDSNMVLFEDGETLHYDLLIVATGTRVAPEMTEGLTGPGWYESAFDFYTMEGSVALSRVLDTWQGGRLVVHIADMPIKCPVAPLEFIFLADAFFTQRGMRDKVELVYATPLEKAFTKPRAAQALGDLLERRGIKSENNFVVASVDGEKRRMSSYDGRSIDYDLLVTVPLHQGSDLIKRSGLGNDDGFIPTHKNTLQSKHFDNVFALGDATDLPTSKAGSVAHFQAEVLTENIVRWTHGLPLLPEFDGHANCFIETGHGKAILIDFNYDTEPLPGRFPLPGVGPFTLLEESYINHWGKLGFRWVYWNLLLRGEELPLDHRMVMAGKWR